MAPKLTALIAVQETGILTLPAQVAVETGVPEVREVHAVQETIIRVMAVRVMVGIGVREITVR